MRGVRPRVIADRRPGRRSIGRPRTGPSRRRPPVDLAVPATYTLLSPHAATALPPLYTAQILDEWGEVIVNMNGRTFSPKPFGKFALANEDLTTATMM